MAARPCGFIRFAFFREPVDGHAHALRKQATRRINDVELHRLRLTKVRLQSNEAPRIERHCVQRQERDTQALTRDFTRATWIVDGKAHARGNFERITVWAAETPTRRGAQSDARSALERLTADDG